MIVCGDFNLPNVTWESYAAKETDVFLSQMIAKEFDQLIREPTHRKGNILDLVFANYENVLFKPPLSTNFSDHLAVQFLLPVCTEPQKNMRQINKLCLPFQSYLPLAEIIEQNIFSVFFALDDEGYIDYGLTEFDNILSPWMKNKRRKRLLYPPYYTSHSMHLLNCVETKRRQKASPVTIKALEIECEKSIELDTIFFVDTFIHHYSSMYSCFELIRHLKSNDLPSRILQNGIEKTCEGEIATIFNQYFASVYQSKPEIKDDFIERHINSIIVSHEEVTDALKTASLGTGIDRILEFFLTYASKQLSYHVWKLFQSILLHARYPDRWKQSRVVPIFKGGDKTSVSCWRPISILPKLSLVFEEVIFRQLYPTIRGSVSKTQFGFMRGPSTVTQLIIFLDSIYKAKDVNETLYAFYFDFSKAFDKVPHDILVRKLQQIGVGGKLLKLLTNYLNNRSQSVMINNNYSDKLPITSGVPQGSILGPLLFIIFIKDLPFDMIGCEFYLFADDSKVLSNDLDILQHALDNCLEWVRDNKMPFNLEKTQFIVFSHNKNCSNSLHLMDSSINPVDKVKDLGITISNNLKWNNHVKNRLKIAYSTFISFRRCLPASLNPSTKANIYKTYIFSSLTYGSEVWSTSKDALNKL